MTDDKPGRPLTHDDLGAFKRTRLCTVCLLRGEKRHTEFVARLPSGFEWWECGNHEAHEHGEILGCDTTARVLTPLDVWLRAHGLCS